MELDGVIRKSLEQARDYRRFHDELAEDPEAVQASILAMLNTIRLLAGQAERVEKDEEGFVGRPPQHTFLPYVTPWVCETSSDELGVTAKMRVATNRSGDEDQAVWCGVVEVLVTDTEVEEDEHTAFIERLAEFTVYEPQVEDGVATLVMSAVSDDDSGLEGSASWNNVQASLNEAIQEVVPATAH